MKQSGKFSASIEYRRSRRLILLMLAAALNVSQAVAEPRLQTPPTYETITVSVHTQCWEADAGDAPGTAAVTVERYWLTIDQASEDVQAQIVALAEAGWLRLPERYEGYEPRSLAGTLYSSYAFGSYGGQEDDLPVFARVVLAVLDSYLLYTYPDGGSGSFDSMEPGPATLSEAVCRSTAPERIATTTIEVPESGFEALFTNRDALEEQLRAIINGSGERVDRRRHDIECGFLRRKQCLIPVRPLAWDSSPDENPDAAPVSFYSLTDAQRKPVLVACDELVTLPLSSCESSYEAENRRATDPAWQ
ncbi:MAG: hypothetical protein KDD44_06365 [Bdellovibrionales bacterium]|nr:hypothetical protein [Bdellovibrionales bacterium]